ncbi:MAG: hypothetical protein K0S27_1248 [Gammaproteobacteria bacterium]|nr:hypothetical protein [Gammaproteobacteria bacterium]
MRIYSEDKKVSLEKRQAAFRSIFSAQIKISSSANPHFENFADQQFQKIQLILQQHRDPCLLHLFYALLSSIGTLFILPIYNSYTYGAFFPTRGEKICYNLRLLATSSALPGEKLAVCP